MRGYCGRFVLSDIAWAGYPGHRGEQAFASASPAHAGLGHGERVTLAMACTPATPVI